MLPVHHDGEEGVQGVVHHQEVGLEQRARAVVGEEHEEELARAEGNVLVERILYEEGGPGN